jgi:flagellar biosynthesis/type III secretory pathway protein FliH
MEVPKEHIEINFRDEIETFTEDERELYKNLNDDQKKLFHDAIAEARAEGQAKGQAEGRAKGKAEGRTQGQTEERRRGVCY